jgi:hypothetical protein
MRSAISFSAIAATLALRLALEGTAAQQRTAFCLLAMVALVLSLAALCLWLAR